MHCLKRLSVLLGFALAVVPMISKATYNATWTGTVNFITQYSPSLNYTPETFVFTMSGQPSVSCAGYQYFVISPNLVTDAETRKNMVAIVMLAKATGGQITVAYDKNGGYCDQGFIGVYYVSAL